MTKGIAAEVKHYRQLRGMSAQRLADACEDLGRPIPRSVLTNLENGRRESVEIAELLVLARALDVPPLLLLIPVGRQEEVEVLPGLSADAWLAAQWFAGEAGPPDSGDESTASKEGRAPMTLRRQHDELVEEWQELARRHPRYSSDDATSERLAARYERGIEDRLRAVRAEMRSRELAPPALPPALVEVGIDQ